MGVSVSETTAERMMVTAKVTANSRKSRPTTSPMKSKGIRTAIKEMVSDKNREADLFGALKGGIERSSRPPPDTG